MKLLVKNMRIKESYQKEIVPEMKKKFGYKNDLTVPKMKKLVVNVGFGRRSKEKDYIENIKKSLSAISGQAPVFIKAKKSISAFKLREGMVIGAKVTLRGNKMYDFVERLVNISFPRVRDFRGISPKCVDRSGNLTIGFKDNFAFPEIEIQDLDKAHGLEVSIDTTAKSKEEGFELFKLLKFPFKE